jgi:ABC-type bacteriocin/lantibiotic exporter with double-glycine peptidase domain
MTCQREVELTFDGRMKGLIVKTLILFVGWCILLVLSWPLALLALVLFPIVWLVALPFRLLGITLEALLAFVRAVLFLPARLFGWRRTA